MRFAPLFIVAVTASIGPGLAAADPTPNRVLTAPTAWLPSAGALVGTGTLDHRFDGSVDVAFGLGGIAALEVGTDTDVRVCTSCDADPNPAPIYLGRAAFRMGVPQNALFHGMPAVVVGVRTAFASSGPRRVRVGEAYLAASRVVGPVRLHAGAMAFDASLDDLRLGTTVRPFGGFEWTPKQYPKTSVLTDIMWLPLLRATDTPSIDTEWILGIGVRYQAFAWGAIDLAVRHRKGDALGDNTVLVRVTGAFEPRPQNKQR